MKKFILHHAPREIYSNINALTFNSYKLLVAYAMVENWKCVFNKHI
jgi:hypothetical protein